MDSPPPPSQPRVISSITCGRLGFGGSEGTFLASLPIVRSAMNVWDGWAMPEFSAAPEVTTSIFLLSPRSSFRTSSTRKRHREHLQTYPPIQFRHMAEKRKELRHGKREKWALRDGAMPE